MAVSAPIRRESPPADIRVDRDCLERRALTELLAWAAARVSAGGRPQAAHGWADSPPPSSPLVILDPGGGGATRALGDVFIPPAAGDARPWTLPEMATIWDGPSLGHVISRALAADQLQRLTTAFLSRPLAVIDDVDRLGRRDVQSAFVRILDAAEAAGVAGCFSLQRHPAALESLEPMVASRLCAGLVNRPQPAAPEVRFAGRRTAAMSLTRVLRAVARHHELEVATLVGPSRCRAVAVARGLAMYAARAVTGSSLQAIGDACGGRDHTTALHSIRSVATRIAADPHFAAEVESMLERLVGSVSGTRGRRHRRRADVAIDG